MLDFFRLVPKKRSVKIKSDKGIIFHNPSGHKKYVFHFGTFVFISAVTYLIYLYWPLATSVISYNKSHSKKNITKTNVEIKKEIEEIKKVEEIKKTEEVKIPVEEFSIEIPKIGAVAEVKKNVSPFDRKEYLPVLEENLVAQAKNTGLPGQKDKSIYLFAHSTSQGISMVRKNSIFYLLGELKNDDPVFIRYNGDIYSYKVYGQKVVTAEEVGYLDYVENNKEVLILQTCWPLGTDWKRLLIFAERI